MTYLNLIFDYVQGLSPGVAWLWLLAVTILGGVARRWQGSTGLRSLGFALYGLLVAPMALVLPHWGLGAVVASLTVLQFVWPGRNFASPLMLALGHGASMSAAAAVLAATGHGPLYLALLPLLMVLWAPLAYALPRWAGLTAYTIYAERLLGAGGLALPWASVLVVTGRI